MTTILQTTFLNAFSFTENFPTLIHNSMNVISDGAVDQIHKSHNALIPDPSMHHSVQKCAHFCSEQCIVVHWTGASWDLWDWSNDNKPLTEPVMYPIRRYRQYPDNKVHGANMGPTWGRQDPGGPHFGHVNVAIWVYMRLRSLMGSFVGLLVTWL